uniref:Uncharacterized LOC100176091 n=1 Tax=Ciona intestinalis TaxID=7719 RepID=H2XQ21_CIOIN|nr:uncharacterized protein LOC100176091 isoform X2 [Ciona intestinalis]|eukprot:XP_002127046.1 uncharacterized protein LOC100176091 isoform X2 [Ciona intestinalis]
MEKEYNHSDVTEEFIGNKGGELADDVIPMGLILFYAVMFVISMVFLYLSWIVFVRYVMPRDGYVTEELKLKIHRIVVRHGKKQPVLLEVSVGDSHSNGPLIP